MKSLISILIGVYLLQIPFEALNPSPPNNSLAPSDESQILVVNMIPQTQSSEEGQDSEPFLALTKDQKLLIAAVYYGQTVFTKNQKQPLFMSEDGGQTWKLISISPAVGQLGGQTYCFSDGT